jgi:hypothetical protein
MAREKKPSPNLTLAESIQNWGRKYGQVEDSYISGLGEALRENRNLHIWATFDPLDYLPIPLLANGSKLASRVRFLTVLRNVLVFAPVALTWIAVGQATTGFQKYISQNTTGVANFLDFWQNGYDILPPEYRISSIARLDAVIILAVIALTLTSSVLGKRAEDQVSGSEAFADRERTALALEIGLFLYEKQRATASVVNASVAASVARLRASTTALESSTKAHAGTAKNLTSATKALEKSAKEIASKKGKTVKAETSNFDWEKVDFSSLDSTQASQKKKWKFK